MTIAAPWWPFWRVALATLGLASILLLPTTGRAQDYRPCTLPASMPPDIRIATPDPAIGRELAAFAGVWEGRIEDGVVVVSRAEGIVGFSGPVGLAVEEITSTGARIVMSGGRMGTAGVAFPDAIHFGSNPTMVMTMNPDLRSINVRVDVPGSRRIGAVLTRCTMGETIIPLPVGPIRAPGRVLYVDNFADPASGWDRQSSDPAARLLGYGDGEYFVTRFAGRTGWSSGTRTREEFADFQVEVDARLVGPTAGAYIFLGFRRRDDSEHYAFVVDPDDQTFRLLRQASGSSSETLVARTGATRIQPGNATNRLGVRADGSSIMLLVNGEEVARIRDDRLQRGGLSLGVGSWTGGLADARFAHLVVTGLE